MSKNIEYVTMIFLIGLLVILFRWSENGHYHIQGSGTSAMLIDTRNGDVWFAGIGTKLSPIEK